jgi:two-component system, sensor histidine kinase and response regulator
MRNSTQTASPPASDSPPGARVRPLWLVGLSLAIFLADLGIPLGTGAGVAYIAAVLASLSAPRARYTWITAALCTALALARVAAPHSAALWSVLPDRGFALFAIWTVAILGAWQKRTTLAHTRAEAEAAEALKRNAALKAALARTEAAEAQLRRGQRLLDTVASMARIGGWEIDLATMAPIWSQEVYRIHELDPSVRLDLANAMEFYAPEARTLVERALKEALEHGVSFDHTVPFITARGQRRWVRVIGVAERTNGVTTRLSGAFQDVTDQHEIQMRLARASRSSSEGHWDYDFGTETVWCSATHEELLGLAPRDSRIPAPEFRARVHPEDQPRVSAAFERHIAAGAPYDLQARMCMPDGTWRWFRTRGAVERDDLGRLTSFAGSLIDVHEERLAQDELRREQAARIEAEQRLERAIVGSSDGFFEYSVAESRMWYSPRMGEMLGYVPQEPLPRLIELMPPEDRERVETAVQRHFKGEAPYDVVYRLMRRQGGWGWFRARGRCERDAEGHPTSFSGSVQDITTEREAESALVAAKEAAAAANRAKSEFLANMSHEIRTPMNGVLGMTELLLDTALAPVQREFAETIRGSATSLLAILNDILDLSKIEAGKLEIEEVEMDVRECVEDVGTMMAVQGAAKNLELIVNVDPSIPDLVLGDPHRLRQILTNLVGNAVKFTHQGEIVLEALVVGVQAGRVLLHFEVRDSGAGMSPEVMRRLFQPFVQADASTTRHYGGTGLGLSIVKRLVELMGGRVGVASASGTGSTFTFTLPCALIEGAVSSAATESVSPRERRVLVVDDNETNQRVLCGQLRPAGYTVETAGSATEAIEELMQCAQGGSRFDVVIADEEMPDCDGRELAARLKSIPGLGAPQLIMLASLDRHGSLQRLRELGFAGYLTKPVRGRELRACIEQVLELDAGMKAAQPAMRVVTRGSLAFDKGAPRFRGHVLVVEDNLVNQQVTRRFLERLGCEVDIAEHGQRAVEFCARERYDLVLMDVQMPIMDGLAATREIRAQEDAGQRVPIIALTASAMTDELERCLASGMDGLLTKPLEPERLGETLARHGLGGEGGATLASLPPMRPVPPAIDLARLRTLVGDDTAFVQELCRTFLASSGRIVEELRRALGRDDRALLVTLAHKLRGGSGSVCAQRIGDLAAVLERSAPARPATELAEFVEQIGAALQECAGFIEAQVA